MGTIRCTRKELEQGLRIPLDERTKIIVTPEVIMLTLLGAAFDPGKSFLLPRAWDRAKDLFRLVMKSHATAALAVGHTHADDHDAEELASERTEVMRGWLAAEPDVWLANYEESVPKQRRWGAREDHLMLRKLPDIRQAPEEQATASNPNAASKDARHDGLVAAYQRTRGLTEDGIAGPVTRKQLILDTFALTRPGGQKAANDQTSEPVQLDMDIEAHSAGSNFPLAKVKQVRDESSDQVNGATNQRARAAHDDESKSDLDARVDVLLFLADSGIKPPPASGGGPYLEWVEAASRFEELQIATAGDDTGTRLKMRLLDKYGRTPHAGQRYELSGPETLSGVTDSEGVLAHYDVLPGDYELKLFLEFFEGADKISDEYRASVVVLDGQTQEQVRMLGAAPRCSMARLRGMLFETNKAFLLPSALEDLQKIRTIYEQNDHSELLCVGHTDTTGDAATNDPLSLERAKSTLAYLEDDYETWLSFYGSSVPESRRWGPSEDVHMIRALLDFDSLAAAGDPIRWFQRTRRLAQTGAADDELRTLLIKAYMALDGAELDSGEFDIVGKAHGCGENFPVDESGEELDAEAPEDHEDALDRRVELFFFDEEFGIVPAPSSDNSRKGSTQYPTWRKHAKASFESTKRGKPLNVRLFDNAGKPLPATEFEVQAGDVVVEGTADAEGFVRDIVDTTADSCVIRWQRVKQPERNDEEEFFEIDAPFGAFVYEQQVFLNLLVDAESEQDKEESTRRALVNLGYEVEPIEVMVRAFQFDNELDETGDFRDVREEVLRRNRETVPDGE